MWPSVKVRYYFLTDVCQLPVYEETAGLTVNDPVLRTHKVREFFLLSLALASFP